MEINRYRAGNHKEAIERLIGTEGIVECIRKLIIISVETNNMVTLKEVVETMWCQEIGIIRIEKLVYELNKGILEDRLALWINFYKKYYRMGFTPYII